MAGRNCLGFLCGICVMLLGLNTVLAQQCGRQIQVSSGDTGTVQSPNYPSPYPPHSNCVYRISSYTASNLITLTFTSFHVESHIRCKFDYLAVYDGPTTSSDLLLKACGDRIPDPVTSTGRYLTIKFVSDTSIQSDGFALNYTVGCSYKYLGDQGNISSPNYPANYPSNSDCDYSILASSGTQMLLTFYYFEVEESSGCKFDYLTFSITGDTELIRFCGNQYNYRMLLNTSRLILKFVSDRSVSRRGFQISYRMTTDCLYENGGCEQICENLQVGKVVCSCGPGFTLNTDSTSCIDVNECNDNPCDETCTNTDGSFICGCTIPGYNLSPNGITCTDMTCKTQNGGCEQLCNSVSFGQYHCSCHIGYFLNDDAHNCTDINECDASNAKYSHSCEQVCVNEPGSYFCKCRAGFKLSANARTCEDIDECLFVNHDCEHRCVNVQGTWECGCYSGYEVDPEDPNFCVDIDECERSLAPASCFLCTNNEGSFDCVCNKGYQSNDDNTDCLDINECDDNNGGCDQVCLNSVGSFTCSCNRGFIPQNNQSVHCVDINECAPNQGRGPCDHFCENFNGKYECECNAGYNLGSDELTCEDINECDDGKNGGCQQQCVNEPGSSSCICHVGYTKQDGNCEDLDECSNNPCDQDVGASCSNTDGSFMCECPPGYLVLNTTVCQDINECKDTEHGCPQDCVNLPGSFRCDCYKGYSKVDDKNCVDINECSTNPCSHTCRNSIGSFMCECNPGFYILGDGRNCSDINECEDQSDDCAQICINEIGYHRCSCREGFTLDRDNITCIDINECTDGSAGCSDHCINSEGSFWCYCDAGYTLGSENKTCYDINECDSNNGGCQHICTNINGTFKCGCDPGFEFNGTFACNDIDECAINKGNCSQECVNQPGSYECQCAEQFRLTEDNKTCFPCPTCEEFQQVRDDVSSLKELSTSVQKLVASNKWLSAKVAELEQRITTLESTQNSTPIPR